MRLRGDESLCGFPCADKLAGKNPGLLRGLFGLGRIPLRAAVGCYYEALGLVLHGFQVRDIAIQLAGILSYELIAFPDLRFAISGLELLHIVKDMLTCACGSGFQKTALIDSMVVIRWVGEWGRREALCSQAEQRTAPKSSAVSSQ